MHVATRRKVTWLRLIIEVELPWAGDVAGGGVYALLLSVRRESPASCGS